MSNGLQDMSEDGNKLAAAKIYFGMRCGDETSKKQGADYFVRALHSLHSETDA